MLNLQYGHKRGFVVDKCDVDCKYDSANDMKSDLKQKVEDLRYIGTHDEFNFGFVVPGHTVKGKQHSIVLDEELAILRRKRDIKMFAPQKSGITCRKRLSMPGDDSNEELPSK